jgi:hypothetical protein
MGRGSTQPQISGNPDVVRALKTATAGVVTVVSDSILFNMENYWFRHWPFPIRGYAGPGRSVALTEATLPLAGMNTCLKYSGAAPYTTFTGIDQYSPGTAYEKKFTANYLNDQPAYASRFFILDNPLFGPAAYGLTDRKGFFPDGVDHLDGHAFTVRLVFATGPWADPTPGLIINITKPDLSMIQGAPFSQYAAAAGIGYAELKVPAMAVPGNLGLGLCGKPGYTSPINSVVNLIGYTITIDDLPGVVVWDCCEGGTRLVDTVTKTTSLAWQAVAAMGSQHVMMYMAANGGYASAGEVFAGAQAVAAAARVPTPGLAVIYGIGCYDIVLPATALPTALNYFEEGYTLAANADANAVFLNMFARGPTHQQGMIDGLWDVGDQVHFNATGKAVWQTDHAGECLAGSRRMVGACAGERRNRHRRRAHRSQRRQRRDREWRGERARHHAD